MTGPGSPLRLPGILPAASIDFLQDTVFERHDMHIPRRQGGSYMQRRSMTVIG